MNKTDDLSNRHDQLIRIMFWARDRAIAGFILAGFLVWLDVNVYLSVPLLGIAVVLASICWLAMFRITNQVHGPIYAGLHVAASILLTPALLSGLILIPLLVKGDANRLLTQKSPLNKSPDLIHDSESRVT